MAQPSLGRPNMRRKSSAQNLLSSLRANVTANSNTTTSGAGPSSYSMPSSHPTISIGHVGTSASAGVSSIPTPTTSVPLTAREWDSQSMQSDSLPSAPLTGSSSPALPQNTSLDYLRDLMNKRIVTLTYIRNIHDGRSHWFHTIMLTREELERVFNNTDMKKRTYRFAVLGMSLSNLFDITNGQDLLRGLYGTLTDYEQSKDENYKPKIRFLRSSKFPKRQAGALLNDYAIPYTDASETSYLLAPHMPFALDYRQTLLSLLDILSEIYNKISKILGPSPFYSGQHMMGPLGLLSPHPGVSYLFQGMEPPNGGEGDGSLWGIANGTGVGGQTIGSANVGPSSPPPTWTPALGESILKIDGKFKKIISMLLKELDEFARNSIKDELATFGPLLRDIAAAAENPRGQHTSEGGSSR